MHSDFPLKQKIAQVGQKYDSIPSVVISVHSSSDFLIPFGSLLVFDEKEQSIKAKIPTTKTHLEKPLGFSLRQMHGQGYEAKSFIAIIRQGRVWVSCDAKITPGDAVYVLLNEQGVSLTTKETAGSLKLKGAIYLEQIDGLAAIEVNFLGGSEK